MGSAFDWLSVGGARVSRRAWDAALHALRNGEAVQVLGPLALGRDDLVAAMVEATGATRVRYCDVVDGQPAWRVVEYGVVVDGPSYFKNVGELVRLTSTVLGVSDTVAAAALAAVALRVNAPICEPLEPGAIDVFDILDAG